MKPTSNKNTPIRASRLLGINYIARTYRKRRKGGGVAVYARTDLGSVDFSSTAAAISEDFELLWVRLTLQGTLIFVGALYHPPKTQSYKEEDLIACIVNSVDEIMTAFPSALTILAGDLNQLSDKVIAERTGLESIVIQPTRGAAFWIEFTYRCRAITMCKLSPLLSKVTTRLYLRHLVRRGS